MLSVQLMGKLRPVFHATKIFAQTEIFLNLILDVVIHYSGHVVLLGSLGVRHLFQDVGPCVNIGIPIRPERLCQYYEQVHVMSWWSNLLQDFKTCVFCVYILLSSCLSTRFTGNLNEDDSLLCLYQHLSQDRPTALDVSWETNLLLPLGCLCLHDVPSCFSI